MPGGRDPRGSVDVQPHVVRAGQACLTGVQTDADPYRRLLRPGVGSELALRLHRRRERTARGGEGDEEGVAFGSDLDTAPAFDGVPDDLAVFVQERAPAVAEALGEMGRSLDVAEQERDRSGRKGCHVWLGTHSAGQFPSRDRLSASRLPSAE